MQNKKGIDHMTNLEYYICEAERYGDIDYATKASMLCVLEGTKDSSARKKTIAACIGLGTAAALIASKVATECKINKRISESNELVQLQNKIKELTKRISMNQFKLEKLINQYQMDQLKLKNVESDPILSRSDKKVLKTRRKLIQKTVDELRDVNSLIKDDTRELSRCTKRLRTIAKKNGDESSIKELDRKLADVENNIDSINIAELQKQRREDLDY